MNSAVGETLVLYGAGGNGREVAWLAEAINNVTPTWRRICFADDAPARQGSVINDIEVVSLDEARIRHAGAFLVATAGNPKVRAAMMERATTAGFRAATLLHPRAEISRWAAIGEGSVVCAGCIVTTNIRMGKSVQINISCTISHDAILDDYATLAPGVHISGNVHLGRCAYVGSGAVIINGTEQKPLTIGDDAIIGAGACVVRSLAAGVTAVGVPARPLK